MAADNEKLGTWQQISLDIPDFLEKTREKINTVAEFLILILDIALAALNIVKVFVATFLNPLGAILAAIIAEINALLRDLRNIGIYIAGDWNLLTPPFTDLLGGFDEYERRMVARLSDRTDPTRPDVSGRITTVGVFFYFSADLTTINKLVRFIRLILRFFNQDLPSGALPTPRVLDVQYGVGTIGDSFPSFAAVGAAFSFNPTPPDIARVRWGVRPPTSKNPLNPFPSPPPAGFMISVSTREEGLALFVDRPQAADSKEPSTATGAQIQPRERFPVLDDGGQPLALYGGADELAFHRSFEWNRGTRGGDPKDGSTRVFGLLSAADNAPVALELLRDGDTYYIQRRFFVETTILDVNAWVNEGFSLQLVRDELPNDARFSVGSNGLVEVEDLGKPQTYYVRVATISTTTFDFPEEELYVYDFETVAGKDSPGKVFQVPLKLDLDAKGDRSPWSEPATVTFPNVNTEQFMVALEAALAVLILSRSDLPLVDEVDVAEGIKAQARASEIFMANVAVTPTGLEGFKDLFGTVYEDFQADVNSTAKVPLSFRSSLRNRVRRVAHDMYAKTGTIPSLEATIVAQTTTLREATLMQIVAEGTSEIQGLLGLLIDAEIHGLTLLQALDDDYAETGFAISPYALGLDDATVDTWRTYSGTSKVYLSRKPQFIEFVQGEDATFSPVTSADAETTATLLASAHPALRMFYEKFVDGDGVLAIPPDVENYLTQLGDRVVTIGSADRSPVLYFNRRDLAQVTMTRAPTTGTKRGQVVFARNLITPRIYAEAKLVLTLAAAVMRRPAQDGEWIAFRLFDLLPQIEDFFAIINRWLKAIQEALRGIAEAIIGFIEFLESRIIEVQQLIRQINALLQSLLLFSFPVGARGLMLVSNGTDGLLGDFVASGSKPSVVQGNIKDDHGQIVAAPEGSATYGGGICIVAPLAPTFLIDLFFLSQDPNDPRLVVIPPQDAFGVEDLPAVPVIGPDAEDEEPPVL